MSARDELRTALANRAAAREAMTRAQLSADRASDFLASVKARVHEFANLNREIERLTADHISAWATQGGEQPGFASEAERHAAEAQAAVATLGASLDVAKRKLGDAQFAVSAAATAVVLEEAKPLADQLLAARREVWALEASLTSLMAMWLPAAGGSRSPRPVVVGKEISDAINQKAQPWRQPGTTTEMDAWRALHLALCAGDADARLERNQ